MTKCIVFSSVIAALLIGFSSLTMYKPDRVAKVVALIGFPLLISSITVPWSFKQDASSQLPSFIRIPGMFILIFSLSATFVLETIWVSAAVHPRHMQNLYDCSRQFEGHIPRGTMILVSGGSCRDESGYPVAYNASYFFYWLDRKGFNMCHEEQSPEKVKSFIDRGVKYFLAEKGPLSANPEFEAYLRKGYPLVSQCPEALLFNLTPANE